MWKVPRMFGRVRERYEARNNQSEPHIPQICVGELATLCRRASDWLIIFDLRESAEIEGHPYAIPGALLTVNVDLYALIPWIPPHTIVVLYATLDMLAQNAHIHLPATKFRFYALEGGLRFWRDAGQPLERVVLSDWKPVDI